MFSATICFRLVFLFFIPTTLSKFCKTSAGDAGKCVDLEMCPLSKTKCDGGQVCCAMMQKIVTPDEVTFPPVIIGVPSPTVFTTPPTTSSPLTFPPWTASPVEITTKMMGGSGGQGLSPAVAKCEEYRHRVKKRASIVTYVFGGTPSLGKEFPHMALLGYEGSDTVEWLCGGSLISDEFVITAAHCITTKSLGPLVRVRLGDLNLQSTSDDARPQEFGVSDPIVHPGYNFPAQYNDIALVKLNQKVQFNDYIAPICLQTTRYLPNANFIATGWGVTEYGSQSDTLLKVDLEYFPNSVCQNNYNNVQEEYLPRGILDDSQICAGSHLELKDTCQGDSGGPLQIRNEILYLVGITSFGKACGVANSPAVYTRVSYYIPWIEQIVWPH